MKEKNIVKTTFPAHFLERVWCEIGMIMIVFCCLFYFWLWRVLFIPVPFSLTMWYFLKTSISISIYIEVNKTSIIKKTWYICSTSRPAVIPNFMRKRQSTNLLNYWLWKPLSIWKSTTSQIFSPLSLICIKLRAFEKNWVDKNFICFVEHGAWTCGTRNLHRQQS